MWDIQPPKPPKPPKKRPTKKPKLPSPKKEDFGFEWHRAPGTPSFRRGRFWWYFLLAFLCASLITGIIYRRELFPYGKRLFSQLKTFSWWHSWEWPSTSSEKPAQITITKKPQPKPLFYLALRQGTETQIKGFRNNELTEIYSFRQPTLNRETLTLGKRYLAYTDSEGVKVYDFQLKQTELILRQTDLAQPTKVLLSPKEDFLAIRVKSEENTYLYLYSFSQNQITEPAYLGEDFVFSSSHFFFAHQNELWAVQLKDLQKTQITTFEKPVILLFRTQKRKLFLVEGESTEINLWEIKKQLTAEKIASFSLASDFQKETFGWAQKENYLFLSFGGEVLRVNLEDKTKQEADLPLALEKLCGYLPEEGKFVALKKSSSLQEVSLVLFDEKRISWESPLAEEIVFLGAL
ncbi:hypothetical protein J7L13_01475 [bacterium]|nr:hypothetical protein [bacterium]